MTDFVLSDNQATAFHQNGFLLVKNLFSPREIDLLARSARADYELDKHSFGRADGEGGRVRLSLWNHPGAGIYGMFARCERVVRSMEKLLGGEVYHYHSKMIMKDPRVGGAWAWHQDYGYWYQNGLLFPKLCSLFIAVDPSKKENGCLQIIPGSHHAGRIDHVLTGDQAGADIEHVTHLAETLGIQIVEMDPGDALFFHANLLHRSDQNRSENPRWSMICCYNAKSNDPYKDSHHPRYTPLKKVPNHLIKEVGKQHFLNDSSPIAWMKPADDTSASSLEKAPPTA